MTNPYQPPDADSDARAEVRSADVPRLKQIASYQRNINLVILTQIVIGFFFSALPKEMAVLRVPVALIAVGASIFFVYRLASTLYGSGWAIFCAVLMLVPCVNLIVMLVLSQGATRQLTAAGYKVGLLGADPDTIR